jgi:hypothetical protein
MTIADEALDNALPCELVKYALRQSKDGIVISFVVHPSDIPAALQTSSIGSRWMAALVQIGDDERPIPQAAKEPQTKSAATPRRLDKPAGAKRAWEELQPAQQAGIRCGEPTFRAFLTEEYTYAPSTTEEAAEAVRDLCCVNSRAQLNTIHSSRVIWFGLDKKYQAWLAKERVGA